MTNGDKEAASTFLFKKVLNNTQNNAQAKVMIWIEKKYASKCLADTLFRENGNIIFIISSTIFQWDFFNKNSCVI